MENILTQRLNELIDYLVVMGDVEDKKDFADKIGKNIQTLYAYTSGHRSVTSSMAARIKKEFPFVNTPYLLTETCAKMLLVTSEVEQTTSADDYEAKLARILMQQEQIIATLLKVDLRLQRIEKALAK